MWMTCFKKFFRIPEELAQVKEEYAMFSSCSEEFNDPDSIHDRWAVSPHDLVDKSWAVCSSIDEFGDQID